MKIRFLMPWRAYEQGQVLDPDSGFASELVRRGIAEEVKAEGARSNPAPKVDKFRKR